LPPHANAIASRQVEPYAQMLQTAARKEYNDAILLRRIKTSINFGLAGIGPILILLHPQSGVWLGALASGWLFFSKFTVDPYVGRRILRGALALEEFDCYVYQLPWNPAMGEPLAKEEVLDSAGRSTYDGEWYPDVARTDWVTAVLICQRSNVVWSRRQHAMYATIVSVAAWIWLSIGIVVTLIASANLSAYLLTVAFPSVPAFLDAIEIRNNNSETASRRRELEISISDAIRKPLRKTTNQAYLRAIQDQIFRFRSTSPLIPKLLYRWLQPRFNENMQQAARRHIGGE
jgi:SMODS-associating 4TM effector domain